MQIKSKIIVHNDANDDFESQPTKRIFKRRKYVDINSGLVFSSGKTYAENKEAFLNAFRMVCAGKFKNIFEAHAALA